MRSNIPKMPINSKIATTAPSRGGTVKNPNANSQSASSKSHPVKPSGKKGGGVKLPVKRGSKGKTGSGYGKGR